VPRFPDRPNLDQLKIQAKELLKSIRAGDACALETLAKAPPPATHTGPPRLTDAQRALARSYGFPSWARMKAHVDSFSDWPRLRDAIRAGNVAEVNTQLRDHPGLRFYKPTNNATDLLSYSAQENQLELVKRFLPDRNYDRQLALSRASMYNYADIMRFLVSAGADPKGPYGEGRWDYGTPMTAICECLNAGAMRTLLGLGGSIEWTTSDGKHHNAIEMLLATYSRDAQGKHGCLAVCRSFGFTLPDTAPMALHSGDLDRLGEHLARDPGLLSRRFTDHEIYPPELGIADEDGLTAAPLPGTTLLHMAIEWDDIPSARWLLEKGADPNARATPGPDGFNTHTPLFHAAVSMGQRTDAKARLLVEAGADPTIRADVFKRAKYTDEEDWLKGREFRQVTAAEFGSVDWPAWAQNPAAVAYLRSLG
jgi:ankyrin repeat protein